MTGRAPRHHPHGVSGPRPGRRGAGWRWHAPHGRRASLFWRVYRHGLLLLAAVLLAVAGAAWLVGRPLPGREPGLVARYTAERVATLMAEPELLRRELARVHEGFGLEVTVYDAAAGLVAANVDPPAPPLPLAERAAAQAGPLRLSVHPFAFAAAIPDGRGYVIVTGPVREGGATRLALVIAVVLAVLAVGSIPLARSIAWPVERLTQAARALGSGDLTARARLRAPGEVGELATAFDEMAERLERLVRGEKELLANVSHELRTPLARIRVALELAEEGDVARARKALGEIGEDLEELERLVEEILAAARLDLGGGGLPVHLERLDLEELLAEVAARFRTRHAGRRLEVALARPLPPIDGDPALLRRLFANLLDNAAKYSEPEVPVALAARAAPEGVVLEVRDQGIGVDAEDLPRLFTPFFRTDRSRARGTGGVGLGLALVRRIAEAHGGAVMAESAPGQGTTLRVTLPAAA